MKEEHKTILKNSSILLVEDENRVRESFKRVLELYVNIVFEARDGIEGLGMFEDKKIDIIFSDVKMPKLNGIDFVKEIRKIDKKVPIVITSAYGDRDYLLESIKLLLVEYLIKPVKEDDLLRVLDSCANVLIKNHNDKIKLSKKSMYDFSNKTFIYNLKDIHLTSKEVKLIELLLLNRGNLVTKAHIENELYIYNEAPPSALKNLVFKLRKKMVDDIIKTVGQHGYMIEN